MKTLLTDSIRKAAKFIKAGDVAAFPTETVYGLGANAYDEKAVRKIFKAKGRPADNPLIVHVASKKDIYVLAEEVNDTAKKIIREFFPGPITVVLKKNEIVPDVVTAGLDSVAIRMPGLKLARDFIKSCGVPVAAPSANLSGSPSPTSYVHVLQDFACLRRGFGKQDDKIPCVLIGPDAKHGLESTVVDCTVNPPVVLRPGVITLEQLRRIDRRIKVAPKTAKVKSPGQKYRHYAPKARVIVLSKSKGSLPLAPSLRGNEKTEPKSAYIGIRNLPERFQKHFVRYYVAKDMNDYARKLFAFFRVCDELGVKTIYAGAVSEKEIGLAIMNRLRKAAK